MFALDTDQRHSMHLFLSDAAKKHAHPEGPTRILEPQPRSRTLKKGIKQLEKYCLKLPASGVLSGDDAFKMYDTYGFPLDLTLLMCEEKGLSVDQQVGGDRWLVVPLWGRGAGR